VRSGGKLYVSGWSYEYVRQNWPGRITWQDERALSQYGFACTNSPDDFFRQSTVDDVPMRDWLAQTGNQNFKLGLLNTRIERVNSVLQENENGELSTQAPKVWVSESEGPGATTRPATVSFQDRCGRVMYSSYNAALNDNDASGTLTPEAKILRRNSFNRLLQQIGADSSAPNESAERRTKTWKRAYSAPTR
jgi:hypothetical protein